MQSKTKVITKGLCTFCNSEIDKAKMNQHLKFCKQRVAANTASATGAGQEAKQKQRLFHILAEGKYNPQYWMHFEIPASECLLILDEFFRDMWVECCDHLSAFKVDGTSYANEPEDFSFDFEIIEASEQDEEDEEDEEGEEKEGMEEIDEEKGVEEVEDLSPEELAEEIGRWLDEYLEGLQVTLSAEWVAEFKKPRSRDDLVLFLKEQQKALPGRTSLRRMDDREEWSKFFVQRNILEYLLEEVEDRSLDVVLEKVLKVGQKFAYEYDFGSTTHLNLKLVSEREGVLLERENEVGITVLARNIPPVVLCQECGKPATQVVSGYFGVEDNGYCDKCARRSSEFEMLLPIVNSPRVGVCGYTG